MILVHTYETNIPSNLLAGRPPARHIFYLELACIQGTRSHSRQSSRSARQNLTTRSTRPLSPAPTVPISASTGIIVVDFVLATLAEAFTPTQPALRHPARPTQP
ncbi:hypothetical protein BC938DRAFT_472397 [Jimgerdemannia flammicorona]|uniref:Uncharacterized protein n=1 Tax=Jimgerdemannia flammicorona TaxID=994334 RepID=A0A433Q675_9FUNG|nr:hypothetical protein BC938DRAFT_472397 [Jimgerdemannia flammicorona]